MIHAYDDILLQRACENLGMMLDFAAHSLHVDAASMMKLFIASGIGDRFARGDIRLIAGMSGIELAYEVMDKSDLPYERTMPRRAASLSAEYCCGYAAAYAQCMYCLTFEDIVHSFPISDLISEYSDRRFSLLDRLPVDTPPGERSEKLRMLAAEFTAYVVGIISGGAPGSEISGSGYTPERKDTNLKKMRIKNGLSQSKLAKAADIPVRTVQQYEQRRKDINRAGAESVEALSRVLNCEPCSLLERARKSDPRLNHS